MVQPGCDRTTNRAEPSTQPSTTVPPQAALPPRHQQLNYGAADMFTADYQHDHLHYYHQVNHQQFNNNNNNYNYNNYNNNNNNNNEHHAVAQWAPVSPPMSSSSSLSLPPSTAAITVLLPPPPPPSDASLHFYNILPPSQTHDCYGVPVHPSVADYPPPQPHCYHDQYHYPPQQMVAQPNYNYDTSSYGVFHEEFPDVKSVVGCK